MPESSKRETVMGASVEITVEIEVEMIPTGNLVVKEVAGWAKAEFTPEQLLAAVKKWASCVRDHAAHKATKKEAIYLKMYKNVPRPPLNNAGTPPKLDLPNKGLASIATL